MSDDHPTPPQPPQHQERQPGRESQMTPRPRVVEPDRRGSSRLEGRAAVITGGDSGIGRAVAVAVAREGADVAIGDLEEHDDAAQIVAMVEADRRRAVAVAGDVGPRRTAGSSSGAR